MRNKNLGKFNINYPKKTSILKIKFTSNPPWNLSSDTRCLGRRTINLRETNREIGSPLEYLLHAQHDW